MNLLLKISASLHKDKYLLHFPMQAKYTALFSGAYLEILQILFEKAEKST